MQAFFTTLILGIITGSVYALASTGIVLTYRTSGILNFGYGGLALFTTYIYWSFTSAFHWPVWLAAAIVVLIIAPIIGFLLDGTLFRPLRGQPIVIGVIATVGIAVLTLGLVNVLWKGETKSVVSLFPRAPIRMPGGLYVGVDQLALFGLAVALALGLAALFRYTKIGVAFRAVVDNRDVAGLMAINTSRVSGSAWAVSTAFAALTGILLTPRLLLDPKFLTPFIVSQVFGASVVGYLQSLPLAWAGGIILGVTQQLLIKYVSFSGTFGSLRYAMPFVMITVFVLLAPKRLRLASLGESFIVKTRAIPRHATPAMRAAVGVVFFGVLALTPAFTGGSVGWKIALTISMVNAIVFLSLVVLTGYSGQISLGQTAFMGIAAFTAGHLVMDRHLSMWIAIALGTLAAVPAGALIGLIAVRIQGLFLALMTLAFAFGSYELFFKQPSVSGASGIPMVRPAGATGDTAYFYFVLIALAACVIVAVNMRSGRTGRVLAAIRDSETASRASGINVFKYKVIVFSVSAAMAGLGGILYAMILQSAQSLDFIPFYSLVFLTLGVVGGIFSVGGALTAGMLYGLFPTIFGQTFLAQYEFILFGLGATLALARNPDGLFGEFRWLGGAVLRLLERRRGARPEPLPVAGGQR